MPVDFIEDETCTFGQDYGSFEGCFGCDLSVQCKAVFEGAEEPEVQQASSLTPDTIHLERAPDNASWMVVPDMTGSMSALEPDSYRSLFDYVTNNLDRDSPFNFAIPSTPRERNRDRDFFFTVHDGDDIASCSREELQTILSRVRGGVPGPVAIDYETIPYSTSLFRDLEQRVSDTELLRNLQRIAGGIPESVHPPYYELVRDCLSEGTYDKEGIISRAVRANFPGVNVIAIRRFVNEVVSGRYNVFGRTVITLRDNTLLFSDVCPYEGKFGQTFSEFESCSQCEVCEACEAVALS